MSFRIEEKIPLTYSDMMSMYDNLYKKRMKELYKKRTIQSLYFETGDFKMFSDAEEGTLPRKKIRIRNYPESKSNYSIEKKYSSIEGRYKTSNKIHSDEYKEFIKNGIFDNLYGLCMPILEVIYEREYYQLENIRITFDNNIIYRSFKNLKIEKRDSWSVVEIKASTNINIDYLSKLISSPRKRFSKFSNGIQAINFSNSFISAINQ